MKNLHVAIWLTFGTIGSLYAQQDLQANVLYEGGTSIKIADFGITFTLPTGWSGILPEGTDYMVVTTAEQDAMLLVSINQTTQSQALTMMNSEIPIPNLGLVLRPKQLTQMNDDNSLQNFYTAEAGGEMAESFVQVKIGGAGYGFVAVGIAEISKIGEVQGAVNALLRSVQFSKVATPPAPTGGGEAPSSTAGATKGSWKAYLNGRYLVKFYSGNGYHEKQNLWLCSDGSCRYYFEGGGFTEGMASGAFENAQVGTWSVTGNTNGVGTVTIRWQDGSNSTYRTELRNDKLYVNGDNWLRDTNQFCQ